MNVRAGGLPSTRHSQIVTSIISTGLRRVRFPPNPDSAYLKKSARQFALNKFNSLAVAKVTCECLLQVKIRHLLPARSGVQVSDCDHEALRLLDMQSGEAHRSPPQTTRIRPKNPYRIKVFWFFFSKKNRFLSLPCFAYLKSAAAAFWEEAAKMSITVHAARRRRAIASAT